MISQLNRPFYAFQKNWKDPFPRDLRFWLQVMLQLKLNIPAPELRNSSYISYSLLVMNMKQGNSLRDEA